MRRFTFVLFAITLLSHVPFAAGLAFALARLGAPFAPGIASTVAVLLVLGLRGRLQRLRADRPLEAWRVLLVEEPYCAHWSATVAAWPVFVVAAIAASILHENVGTAALASYLTALVVCLYGVFVRRRWVRVRSLDVAIAGLGPAFDGYRIAQLSDLHIGGLWSRRRAARWVSRVNALDVDLVALTGDYVTHGTSFHEDIAAVLAEMRGRDGAVAVMGNHDYFGDGESLVGLLRARGVVVLRNEHRVLWRGGEALTLAGVDDTWSRRADVTRALAGHEGGRPLIALAHDPQLFPELARRGAGLVLSGHTHWGQIALPFLATRYNLSRLSYRYHAGLYRDGAAVLYVSPGLGTTGPPVRVGAPPEITVLRLRAALRNDAELER
jgi:predicted MPP superfamily phosphohydrolase